MKNWSKLQKELYLIIDPEIDLQIHCVAYRMKSQRGNTNLPRYFITLGKQIVFDYPKQFPDELENYPYENDASEISNLIREYIDTPPEELLRKRFANDKWQLTEILKSADRRIGQRRLDELLLSTNSEAAKRIIALRKNKTSTD